MITLIRRYLGLKNFLRRTVAQGYLRSCDLFRHSQKLWAMLFLSHQHSESTQHENTGSGGVWRRTTT